MTTWRKRKSIILFCANICSCFQAQLKFVNFFYFSTFYYVFVRIPKWGRPLLYLSCLKRYGEKSEIYIFLFGLVIII
jgi:hypothetical protein